MLRAYGELEQPKAQIGAGVLLEKCSSVKVKRIFLYLAEKCKHDWLEFVDLSKVDLGSGKRSLVKNGVYIEKYKITVPKELEKNEKPKL